jgi:hypothetical protein
MNRQTVNVTIGGVEKTVELSRLDDSRPWLCKEPVIVRFPTGTKTHKADVSIARERDGQWSLQVQGFRNANSATIWHWADQAEVTSKW